MSFDSFASSSIRWKRSAYGGEFVETEEVVLLASQAEIGVGDGVEVVVGERDEAEAETAQRDNFVNDALVAPRTRLLPVGAPYAAEGAVLGTSAGGLHRRSHIFVGLH